MAVILLRQVTFHQYADGDTYFGLQIEVLGVDSNRSAIVSLNQPLGSFLSTLQGSDVQVEVRAYFPLGSSVVRKPMALFIAGARRYECEPGSSVVAERNTDDPDQAQDRHAYRQAYLYSGDGYVLCDFWVPPFQESFVSRVLWLMPGADQVPSPSDVPVRLRVAKYDLDFDVTRFRAQDDVHIDAPMAGGKIVLNDKEPDAMASVSWRDIDAEQWRDIVLVMIGTLAGTGTAACFEWMRPWLEANRA